jgi:cytochrome c
MKYLSILPLILFLFLGCKDNPKVDAKNLLETSCSKCHNLLMPPIIPKTELAPPMMAVVFHIKEYITTLNPSEHKNKFTSFVSDYILTPSIDKSYCDKKSIKHYGLMPSLKGKLTINEAMQVANYIYDKYDAPKFYKKQKEKAKFLALPKGEQLAISNGCFSCHSISKVKIAPSFKTISEISTKDSMFNSLLNGSKNKYKGFTTYMPPLGKNMSKQDLNILTKWISTQKELKKQLP